MLVGKKCCEPNISISFFAGGRNFGFLPRFTIVAGCREYSNAEEGDLWEALTEEIRGTPTPSLPPNVTVKQLMDTWTLQDGYPVLTVTRNYTDGSAVLSQVRHTCQH
jgi:aminopeptidase N